MCKGAYHRRVVRGAPGFRGSYGGGSREIVFTSAKRSERLASGQQIAGKESRTADLFAVQA